MQPCLAQIDSSAPSYDELEVSLFGPGVGECAVVHIGNGEWLVVDSCINPTTKNPIAMDYLNSLGVVVERDVKSIVISHWHSDHIGGASDLVNACTSANVVYSQALLKEEFLTLVQAISGDSMIVDRRRNGLNEISKIIKVLRDRGTADSNYIRQNLKPAAADKRIYFNASTSVEVWTLSPSDVDFNLALEHFGSLLEQVEESKYRGTVPAQTENKNAVVVWVKVGEVSALLGADLEEFADDNRGWSAILNSVGRPQDKSAIFKIPHHGSETGYCSRVWEELLIEKPVAALTTYSRSRLPRMEELEKLSKHSDNIYLTTSPSGKKVKRSPTVEKMMKGMVKERRVLNGDIGHVQIRAKGNKQISVACNDVAERLKI